MKNNWHSSEKFNRQAADFDSNLRRTAIADAVASAITKTVPLKGSTEGLEFGCGTGLVTMQVAPRIRHLTAIDTSHRMLGVLEGKLLASGTKNIDTLCLDLSSAEDRRRLKPPYDFIYSSMTLHHIDSTAPFLGVLFNLLSEGGVLAIADLDHEEGLFHDDPEEKVHPGFDRKELAGMLEQAGFEGIAFTTAHTVEKKNRAGVEASYPIFLLTARKPSAISLLTSSSPRS
ncbi:class I SAM-dependent methyltransferase [Chlorobium phaeovibrioides]|uniref:Class I SAM-dependent methyltransferase n=1 Tax=Chlorobium phaeovibrioides TaxID=1094 RepID=A0A3S0NBK3_CHLPH|nr:class I SAM-dependent methyltransferase [Chlorobium phaeovibrioides]MWV53772.1 methyltransferase domain-containing protein [Chlorobium phaeovibrioides]QEQ56916.1 class I SAM-dependent methyltransferase [Chlorobium phaeovibrioides]RTY37372.1 class I SAM-dependent methyltransferase [Chlorobium phaeovibrioides]RTY39866.1 class I SAM-dependent methyltransferase [Chlorobium phaeovibrioides]